MTKSPLNMRMIPAGLFIILMMQFLLLSSHISYAQTPINWQETQEKANGGQVYFYAWGGGQASNDYISWAKDEVKTRYNISLIHVKIEDTALAVKQVLAEKIAGADDDGKMDLIWINGENFRTMKQNDLLYGPFANQLPNWIYLNENENPNLIYDFTIPTDYFEMPWGQARLTFYYDQAKFNSPPDTAKKIMEFVKKHSGRFTYPAPPDFTGTTFLKQLLLSLNQNHDVFMSPPIIDGDDENFTKETARLWQYLDEITPYLWQDGKNYPKNKSNLRQLFADHVIDIGFSFDIAEAATAINQGLLEPSVRSYMWENGTIGNSHFLAIPYNSPNKEAALMVANFLLSPIAQAKKQDPTIWGDMSVLSMSLVNELGDMNDQNAFNNLPKHEALIDDLGPSLPEPHPGWVDALEIEWLKRYGR